jgi:hypothetical protein
VRNWETTPGHYSHSQVPENTHWDPAYTDDEWWQLHYWFDKYKH